MRVFLLVALCSMSRLLLAKCLPFFLPVVFLGAVLAEGPPLVLLTAGIVLKLLGSARGLPLRSRAHAPGHGGARHPVRAAECRGAPLLALARAQHRHRKADREARAKARANAHPAPPVAALRRRARVVVRRVPLQR